MEIEYLHFLNMDYYVVTQSLAEAAYARRVRLQNDAPNALIARYLFDLREEQ